MSNKNEIIIKFNKIVEKLLIDTSSYLGNSYLKKFKFIITFNKKMPINRFCTYCLKYKEQILSRNPDYFLNYELYVNETSNLDDKDFYLNEVLNLTEIYMKADEDSRNNLWDIMTALIFLAENYK